MAEVLWINASLFLAPEIAGYIFQYFFRRLQNKGQSRQGHYNHLRLKIPPALIAYTCTLLRDALIKWQRNGGAAPTGGKNKELKYPFSKVNDLGEMAKTPPSLWKILTSCKQYTSSLSIPGIRYSRAI